jgi:uncharacterized caspase-like protein
MTLFRALACLAVVALACPTAFAEKYALLIGISEYDYVAVRNGVVSLQYADEDAQALADLLKKEYRVKVLVNEQADRDGILTAFSRLRDEVKEEDSFVLFFAGHGLRDPANQKTYWLTYKSRLDLLEGNGIRLEHLLDYVRDIKAKKKLVLLDHCYSGDVAYPALAAAQRGERSGLKLEPEIKRGIVPVAEVRAQLDGRSGGLVVLAAARNEALESSKLGHGLFTEAVRRSFTTRKADGGKLDGRLSLGEMIAYVATQVDVLAREQNFEQKLVTFKTDVVDEQDWGVLELPPEGTEAEIASQRYLKTLREWREQTWVTSETVVECQTALNAWVDERKRLTAGGGVQPPPPATKSAKGCTVALVEEAMRLAERKGPSYERAIAEDLQARVAPPQ